MSTVASCDTLGERIAGEWRAAQEQAETLLVSLLNERQRSQWRRWRAFWVDTPIGRFRLGRESDIRYRPADYSDVEFTLCIVSSGRYAHWQPADDLWATMLLLLHADPEDVLACAAWLGVRSVRKGAVLEIIRTHAAEASGLVRTGLLVLLGRALGLRGRSTEAEQMLAEAAEDYLDANAVSKAAEAAVAIAEMRWESGGDWRDPLHAMRTRLEVSTTDSDERSPAITRLRELTTVGLWTDMGWGAV